MDQVRTYQISLPFSLKDYNFLKKYIDRSDVEIDDEIRKAFMSYKLRLSTVEKNIVLDRNDYTKFIDKLKEKKFIERFENGFGNFNVAKFYLRLEKKIRKEKVLFDKNYNTGRAQVIIIDNIIEKILDKCFDSDSPRWLIRTYIAGRAIYCQDKYKPLSRSNIKIPLSYQAKKLARENNLPLELAKQIDIALDYTKTTIKCLTEKQLKDVRRIIIDEDIIKKQPVYKLVDKVSEILPNNDVYLLNIDWNSVLRNELNYISNRSRLELRSPNSYVVCESFKGCCDACSKDIAGRVFKVSEAPQIPYEKCSAEICLCILLPFNPEFQYVSADGQIKLKFGNESEWEFWYSKNIVSATN